MSEKCAKCEQWQRSFDVLRQWLQDFAENANIGPAIMPDGTIRQFAIEARTLADEIAKTEGVGPE